MFSASHAGPSTSRRNPQPGPQSATTLQLFRQSGQRPGETWEEFFARRSHAYSEKRSGESAPDREARRQRTEHARGGRCPGKKGANVFHWEELDGVRIRTPVGYSRYMAMWDDFHGAQRRYDPFFNEWDLCSEFDPTAHSDLGEEGDDTDDEPIPSEAEPRHNFRANVSETHFDSVDLFI